MILITSSPFIMNNKIYRNKFHGNFCFNLLTLKGIIMIKDSQPFIQGNLISENQHVGLYIRDKSKGKVEMNRVKPYLANIHL